MKRPKINYLTDITHYMRLFRLLENKIKKINKKNNC